MSGAFLHRIGAGSAQAFDAAVFGGSEGDAWAAITLALRPASGQTISFVGWVPGGDAGRTTNLDAFNFNGALTGGSGANAIEGDYVLAPYATGATADRTLAMVDPVDYTTLADLYADSAAKDVNLSLFIKRMGASPDASFQLGPQGATTDAGAYGAYVLRGVHASNPIIGSVLTATDNVAACPNPPAITPATPGAVIICVGATAKVTSFTSALTSSDLSNFEARKEPDTNAVSLGIGMKAWSN